MPAQRDFGIRTSADDTWIEPELGLDELDTIDVGHEPSPIPGTAFAPIFGLPGQHVGSCSGCPEQITRAGAGAPWVHDV